MLQYAGNQTWIKSIQMNSSIWFGLPPILQRYQTKCYSMQTTVQSCIFMSRFEKNGCQTLRWTGKFYDWYMKRWMPVLFLGGPWSAFENKWHLKEEYKDKSYHRRKQLSEKWVLYKTFDNSLLMFQHNIVLAQGNNRSLWWVWTHI